MESKSITTQKAQKLQMPTEGSNNEAARTSALTGYDTENQLGNNLISVTLAFVALIATAITAGNVLGFITNAQRWLILAALIIFSISIAAGLINYFANMLFHQYAAVVGQRSNAGIVDSDTATEKSNLRSTARGIKPARANLRNNLFLAIQIILLMVGLIVTITFVATLLFQTSDQLPTIE